MQDLVIQQLTAKNGEPTLQINEYLIHSKYNPSQEAKKIVEQEYREGYVYIVFGLGAGHIPWELMNKGVKGNQLIIFDPLLNKLKIDYSIDGIFIDSLDEIEDLLGAILKNYSLKIQVIALSNYKKLFPELYKELLLKIEKFQYMNQVSMNTVIHFAEIWQENYVKNIGMIDEVDSLSTLFNKYTCPVVITSAGPSLKKQLQLLKKVKEQVVILCSGSTITALLAEGIEPDYIVSVDGGEANFHHFQHLKLTSSKLIYAFSNNYKIQNKLNVQKYTFINYEDGLFGELLKEKLNLEMARIVGGGSVALFAYSIALKMTSGPIALIGQDFAFTNGQTHSSGHRVSVKVEDSYYATRQKIFTEGYYGEQVETDYPFLSMKVELEKINKIFGDRIHIYNCTEGGVKLEGFKQLPFEEFVTKFISKDIIKESVPFETIKINRLTVQCWLESELNNLRQSKTVLKEILLELKLVKSKKLFSNASLNKINKLDNIVLKILNEGLMMRIIQPIIISTMENFSPQKGESDSEAFFRVYEQNHHLYNRLLAAVEKNILFIQHTVEYLKEK